MRIIRGRPGRLSQRLEGGDPGDELFHGMEDGRWRQREERLRLRPRVPGGCEGDESGRAGGLDVRNDVPEVGDPVGRDPPARQDTSDAGRLDAPLGRSGLDEIEVAPQPKLRQGNRRTLGALARDDGQGDPACREQIEGGVDPREDPARSPMLPFVQLKIPAETLLPAVGRKVLEHSLLARSELRHDLLIRIALTRELPQCLAKDRQGDRQRVGEGAVQVEYQAVQAHRGSPRRSEYAGGSCLSPVAKGSRSRRPKSEPIRRPSRYREDENDVKGNAPLWRFGRRRGRNWAQTVVRRLCLTRSINPRRVRTIFGSNGFDYFVNAARTRIFAAFSLSGGAAPLEPEACRLGGIYGLSWWTGWGCTGRGWRRTAPPSARGDCRGSRGRGRVASV